MSLAKVITWGVAVAFALPSFAHAAQLSVSATPMSVQVGSTVTVTVYVNSEGTAINNAEGSLMFPRDLFDVVSVSSDVSVFSLWIQAPTYNGNNAISFNGGLPSPGYVGASGKVFSAVLRAKAAGSAAFTLENTAVRANDGLGTNVLTRSTGGFAAVQAPQSVPVVQPTPTTPKPAPATNTVLAIRSETHPSEDRWYAAKQAVLAWDLPAGTEAVQTLLSDSPTDIPAVLYQPPVTERKLDDLEDGVWYFAVRARSASGWGKVVRYKLQVDTTPPALRDVRMEYVDQEHSIVVRSNQDTFSTAHIAVGSVASDSQSGVAQVDILIDGEVKKQVAYADLSDSTYQLPLQLDPGTHTANLRVYDYAGNSAESEPIEFEVVTHEHEHDADFSDLLTSEHKTTIVLSFALLLSLISIMMNIVLWLKLHRGNGGLGGGRNRLQQRARQKIQSLINDINRQRKELESQRERRDITPEDAEYIQKMCTYLAETEKLLTEKICQINKQ